MTGDGQPHVAVVGGGIAGLAAAHRLGRSGRFRVTVLEAAHQVGGKLAVSDVAGVPVDEGAESLLLRRPEAVELAAVVGLGDDLVDAATTSAGVWSRGAVRPLPTGTVMGVPSDLRALARSGVLTGRELARVPVDAWLRAPDVAADVAVGKLVGARMGRAVVERLVDPLLGGVYAGRADQLSLAATLPALVGPLGEARSLLAAARTALTDTSAEGAVFGAPRGGVGRLPAAVAKHSGADIRARTIVRELERTSSGWRLVLGSADRPEVLDVDAVVVAVPAPPAARLLRTVAPTAAAELSFVRYASMAVVTLAFPSAAVFPRPLIGSGFLVPGVERRAVKAVTFTSQKWSWYAGVTPGLVLLRASVGRVGEESVLQRDDAELVDLVLSDLADLLGVRQPPVDVRVSRWGGGLPQYAVGHLDRVARIRAAVAAVPGLAVAGALYQGVGIPACVASGQQAAAEVLRQWPHDRPHQTQDT